MLSLGLKYGESVSLIDEDGVVIGRVKLINRRRVGQFTVGFDFVEEVEIRRDGSDQNPVPVGDELEDT